MHADGDKIFIYSYKYGLANILENGIVAGALFVLILYFVTGNFWKNLFVKKR